MNEALCLPHPSARLEAAIDAFPVGVRPYLDAIRRNGGFLGADDCRTVAQRMHVDDAELMIRLLPLARSLAVPPISRFCVGAIARGAVAPTTGWGNLYFGANIEFEGEALSTVVHAEQAAVNHAWLRGEVTLSALAVTAAPCGYCRQFLNEMASARDMPILLPDVTGSGCTRSRLRDLLPEAFGPADLGYSGALLEPDVADHSIELVERVDDPVVLEALAAARSSYAPYTKGFAGCAIQTEDGAIYPGRYAESAAYSPSLAPLQSALAFMFATRGVDRLARLSRAVLVEVPSRAGLRRASEAVLASFAPGVVLESLRARCRADSPMSR